MAKSASSSVNQGDVAGAISSFYGVSSGDPSVGKLLALVLPDVERASAADPRSWKSVIPGVLAKYESVAREMGLGVSPVQRAIEAAKNGNPTGAGPFGLDPAQAALRLAGNVPLAMRDEGGSSRGGERPSNAAITRDAPLTVNGAISYARELGINPAQASFFVGASADMREALKSAIRDGANISDDKVKSMRDVSAVLGAIRAGKLKADDPRVPPSVKKVIEDMKSKGIDPATADPKDVQKYLKENPGKLDEIKKANASDLAAKATLTDQEKLAKIGGTKAASDGKPGANGPSAPAKSAKLNV
jgi:hypothetical protein